jgi:membrane protease YdiL (CAAX protease family)
METQATVDEVKRAPARWSTTMGVVFGPTLVMLLISAFLVYILHYSTTSLAFAYAYVYASVVMLVGFLGIVALLLKREGSSLLRLINLDPAQLPKQLIIGGIICIIRLVIAIVYTIILNESGVRESPIVLRGLSYLFALVVGSTAAGFCTEIIWRGYGITRLETLTKNTLWAVIISTLGSALWRLDLTTIGSSIIGGLLFGLMYVKLRSLVPVIFGHWTKDIIGYVFQYLPFTKF